MTGLPSPRERMRTLAAASLARGDATTWFEQLYREADGDPAAVSWADLAPNPLLVEWLTEHPVRPGTRALVPGCGLGDEAVALARAGAAVTAFDVSPTAVAWAQARHHDVPATWLAADLLDPPPEWRAAFDLVVEVYTLQCLPDAERARAIDALTSCVAPGGVLVAIGRLRDDGEPADGPPWPLTRAEVERFATAGLEPRAFADRWDAEDPPVRRFVAAYAAPGAA